MKNFIHFLTVLEDVKRPGYSKKLDSLAISRVLDLIVYIRSMPFITKDNITETWSTIPGFYKKYKISTHLRIVNNRKSFLKITKNKVNLSKRGRVNSYYVIDLAIKTFGNSTKFYINTK